MKKYMILVFGLAFLSGFSGLEGRPMACMMDLCCSKGSLGTGCCCSSQGEAARCACQCGLASSGKNVSIALSPNGMDGAGLEMIPVVSRRFGRLRPVVLQFFRGVKAFSSPAPPEDLYILHESILV